MQFKPSEPLELITCHTCLGIGYVGWKQCRTCGGYGVARAAHQHVLYWKYPLERYHVLLEHGRRFFNKIRFVVVLLIGINFWVWAGLGVYHTGGLTFFVDRSAVADRAVSEIFLLFLFGLVCFSYLLYRAIREQEFGGLVEHYAYDEKNEQEPTVQTWEDVRKTPKRYRHNIADTFTPEARTALGNAYLLADRSGAADVTLVYLFNALLASQRISNIFIRLGIPTSVVQEKLATVLAPQGSQSAAVAPVVGPAFYAVLFEAYEVAYNEHQDYVGVTELLDAVVAASADLQELLYDLDIDSEKLHNVIAWARIRERLYRQYAKLRHASAHRSTHGMDKAMTAVATPYLNHFSEDVTLEAQFGQTDTCVAREKEIESIFRIVEGGQESVVLVGDFGVGKQTIVEGIAERMVEDDVPDRLKDKRMVRLSIPTLLAGTTPAGAVDRLISIMDDVARSRNIILFIHNLHELVGVSAGEGDSLDIAGTLAEYVGGESFMTFCTTTPEAYAKYIANSKLGSVLAKVEVAEMDENQAIQALESKVGYLEYKHQVFFAYEAIEKAVRLAKRFLHESYLPGNAFEVLTEAASLAHKKKGVNTLVTGDEVAAVIAEKTKIPVTTISADESTKLMHLEEAMHQRVVGQDEAVGLVANALRRARAEIRSQSRPIANFLFLGPTGVGKTELAKTIAEVYFGGENRMVRLDMSEYQDKASLYRLIGTPGQRGSGVLTEAVRRSPFTLLLLDEIEKADKDILNLFLQVMDDGRLTDSTGHVVDFTNVIIIATSNAGTQYVQEQMQAGLSSEAIKERLLHGELKQNFRPEFLNRFDGIVLFKPLDREAIKRIAGLMLKRIGKDLENKGIELQVESPALDFLADVGFDPEFGARPMRRALQERVENQLAQLLLAGQLKRRDTVVVGEGGKVEVK